MNECRIKNCAWKHTEGDHSAVVRAKEEERAIVVEHIKFLRRGYSNNLEYTENELLLKLQTLDDLEKLVKED